MDKGTDMEMMAKTKFGRAKQVQTGSFQATETVDMGPERNARYQSPTTGMKYQARTGTVKQDLNSVRQQRVPWYYFPKIVIFFNRPFMSGSSIHIMSCKHDDSKSASSDMISNYQEIVHRLIIWCQQIRH